MSLPVCEETGTGRTFQRHRYKFRNGRIYRWRNRLGTPGVVCVRCGHFQRRPAPIA